MNYDPGRFLLKEQIDGLIPIFREDFLQAHGLNVKDIPFYDIGIEYDIHRKWRISVLKIMGRWRENSKTLYPNFYKFVNSLGNTCRSAGYSILEPGADIKAHTDTEMDHEDYVIVHVPLIIPKGDVGFTENGEKGQWIEGESFILDVETPHSMWNNTEEPRIVILLELLKDQVYV